jgi:glutamyl-tRNA synthetase
VPLHVQLFNVLGFELPEFGHIAPIQKIDDGSKRKLSKRSDPEASMTYYSEKGYPVDAVLEYLLNLANSAFADFRKENPKASLWDFPFEISGLNKSGALLDLVKLDSVSKDYISRLSAEEIYDNVLTWANDYDTVLAGRLKADKAAFISVFEIERKGVDRVRKDLSCWSMIWDDMTFFFNEHFVPATFETATDFLGEGSTEHALAFLKDYRTQYDFNLPGDDWFPNMKELAGQHKYAPNPKTFKKNPDDYVGSVADAAKSLRVALTGRAMTPDLYSTMQVLGEDTVRERLDGFIQVLENGLNN